MCTTLITLALCREGTARPHTEYTVGSEPPPETSPDWINTLFDKIYAAYNDRDAGATADCYTESMEILVNGEPGPADRAGFIEALGEQWNGFPDVNAAEVHRLVRGDQVITEMIIEGHNAAEFLGRRATGKLWRVAVAWVCRVADGRVASLRVYVDNTPLQAAVRVGERL
ncbi:MAG TPA: ester cyclase, partial [Dehalococcoidia bacterium]|nr:ester cyclase [Dehalococcoidia bacterium]